MIEFTDKTFFEIRIPIKVDPICFAAMIDKHVVAFENKNLGAYFRTIRQGYSAQIAMAGQVQSEPRFSKKAEIAGRVLSFLHKVRKNLKLFLKIGKSGVILLKSIDTQSA